MKHVQSWQMVRFYMGEGFNNRASHTAIESKLSARYRQSCLNQVVAGLKSWQEGCKAPFAKIVTNSNLPEATKVLLYRINIRKAWHQKSVELPELDEEGKKTGSQIIVDELTMKLARQIIKRVKRRCNRVPNLGKSKTMCLDGTVAQVEKSKSPHFDYYVRVSSLTKYKTCLIPLKGNRFFDEAPGEVCNVCQVRVEGEKVSFSLVKVFDLAPAREGIKTIGLDYGLNTLFATSMGDQLGKKLYPWLLQMDEKLAPLGANLQRQKIKLTDSKRYCKLNSKIRDYTENEVNRCLNQVMTIHNPDRPF
jgi:putative transposase